MVHNTKKHLHALERDNTWMVLHATQCVDYSLSQLAQLIIAIVGRFLTKHMPHKVIGMGRVNAMPLAAMMALQRRAISLDATQSGRTMI